MLLLVGLISASLGFLIPALCLLYLAMLAYRSRSAASTVAGWQSVGSTDVPTYDVRRLMAFRDADSEMSVAFRAAASLRPEGRLQLMKCYLAYGDRHYLGGLIQGLNSRFVADTDPYSLAGERASRLRPSAGFVH